eukprot:XP_014781274.1 PREDICTED: quinone oxidoreductase PIG3-like [Octopus bimaculoides]
MILLLRYYCKLISRISLFVCILCTAFRLNVVISHAENNNKTEMLAAYFDSPGEPDVLYVNQVLIPELKDDEVLVKVQASAINRADTLQVSIIIVVVVVVFSIGGGNAEFVAVHFKHVMPMPENMNFLEAAAIPEVWLTAFQLLHFVGKLQPEDYVLVHAGASGVGTAAIQLVTLAKGKAIVTAGSEDKIKLALELGASAGFNYKETDFSEEVMKFTEGRGVNLILDCVGGVYWEMNVNCLAMDGRWVLYGLLGGRSVNGNLFLELLKKRISLMATTLRTRTDEYKGQLVEAFSQQTLSHFERGHLKPVMDSVFPLDQINAAHEKMEANKNMGKIMIRVAKDNTDAVSVVDNINKEETQIKTEL